MSKEQNITGEYLQTHPNHIFVFGDNWEHRGNGGAAKLRSYPNTYGFITKKRPDHNDESYYRPEEYLPVYQKEIERLKTMISLSPDKTFLISKIGAGLANKHSIFETIIEPRIKKDLEEYPNVVFLW